MILLKRVLQLLLLLPVFAYAADEEAPSDDAAKTVSEAREPFASLVDQVIGDAFRPLVFDWRRKSLLLSLQAGQIAELNNFESRRYGLELTFPTSSMLVGFTFARVETSATSSSRLIARTPYRQAGRPSRFEFDTGIAIPLAEGIVTQRFNFIPAAHLLLTATGKMRYLYYPDSGKGYTGQQAVTRLFSKMLSNKEQENIEKHRLEGMKLDRARYNALAGVRIEMFFRSGLFLYNQTQLNIPYQFNDEDGLGAWWDLSLGFGYGF